MLLSDFSYILLIIKYFFDKKENMIKYTEIKFLISKCGVL